ncbi:MAG: M55 family metallopeptidase [Lentisphaeria bacterium]|nr:M55 family metallopeptidase [Lentisphaeria bacterium]NQZ69456.1 M55 family metallopeptidase [Lentisphaeria bacterium]
MKLFMLWDMEGVSGLFRREQTWHWEERSTDEDYKEGRELLVADINAASITALENGVDDLIICDTHGGGGNIIMDQMLKDDRITYVNPRGEYNGKFQWMPGLDEKVDGFLTMGHHSMYGTPNSFLPHSNFLTWRHVKFNGVEVGEMAIESTFAAYWGVPYVMAQGDNVAMAEAKRLFPWIVTAEVKQSVDYDRCKGPSPEEGRAITKDKLIETIAKIEKNEFKPYEPGLPLTITMDIEDQAMLKKLTADPRSSVNSEGLVEATVNSYADVLAWTGSNVGINIDPPN